jgi:FkbM family methyltransferase
MKWQIGSRLVPGPVVYPWIEGTKFIVRHGDTGFTQNIYCGLHEFQEMAYILHVTTPEDLFIDVGANVGSYTILACGARGARGYCFEPIPETYQKLLENIKINDLTERVKPYNIGIADQEGELSFTADRDTMNHVVTGVEQEAKTIKVQVCTLDQILAEEKPTILKIDVEGFEGKVIAGALRTLENPSLNSIIIEIGLCRKQEGGEVEGLLEKICSMGFLNYEYDPIKRNFSLIRNQDLLCQNMLYIRDINLINKKISSAKSIDLFSQRI